MCLGEVDLPLFVGYLDSVCWLKSQLKRVGSSLSGDCDFCCLESLSRLDDCVCASLSECVFQCCCGIFLRSRCVLKDCLSLSFSRSCRRRDGV